MTRTKGRVGRSPGRRNRCRATLIRAAVLSLPLLVLAPAPGGAASPGAGHLPFSAGEELTFEARSARVGTFGTGTMKVARGEVIRGRGTHLLSFEFRGRVAIATVEDRTRSWVEFPSFTSLRYQKRERSPLGTRSEEVEMIPEDRVWRTAQGDSGPLPSESPLDELSFLYFIRTLPLTEGAAYSLNRHFDPERNPVRIRVVGRETVTVPAGTFATVKVEMRVQDAQRFGGGGVIRLHLTDDGRRIPVRLETSMPVVGAVVLSLTGGAPQGAGYAEAGAAGPAMTASEGSLPAARIEPDTLSSTPRQIAGRRGPILYAARRMVRRSTHPHPTAGGFARERKESNA